MKIRKSLAGVGVAAVLLAPTALASPAEAGRTWTAPLASVQKAGPEFAPKHLSKAGLTGLNKTTTCSTNKANYRAIYTVAWWGSGSNSGTDQNKVTFQKKIGTTWSTYDWAGSMNSDFRDNATIRVRFGPTNPGSPITFYFVPDNDYGASASANVHLRASGNTSDGAVSLDCVQYSPYG